MAEVFLEHVTKVYPPGVRAVEDVNLRIDDGEFVVLVGPSGCGKSTTLRMIAGLEEITEGVIRIGQRVVNHLAPKDRDIAMVFQNYALYPNMTVYRNMAFGLMLRRRHAGWGNPVGWLISRERYRAARAERAEIRQRVHQTARMLGIEHLLDRRPRALSGGERQRVAVGRALVREPQAFLFDEPLSNLDARLRVEMRAELKRLHRRLGTTAVYVTHDQEEAMTLGDRIVVMKDGRVQQCDTPLAVYERPANRFVAGFIGVPPMNFLEGRVAVRGDDVRFDDGTLALPVPPRLRERLARFADRPIVLGVRPEGLAPAPAPGPGVWRVRVGVIEPLGDKVDAHVTTESQRGLVCRLDARAGLKEGAVVHMQIDPDRVHFFEPAGDGRNVGLLNGAPAPCVS